MRWSMRPTWEFGNLWHAPWMKTWISENFMKNWSWWTNTMNFFVGANFIACGAAARLGAGAAAAPEWNSLQLKNFYFKMLSTFACVILGVLCVMQFCIKYIDKQIFDLNLFWLYVGVVVCMLAKVEGRCGPNSRRFFFLFSMIMRMGMFNGLPCQHFCVKFGLCLDVCVCTFVVYWDLPFCVVFCWIVYILIYIIVVQVN